MEPLNSKERTSATFKMAGLFLLTLIIFTVAIYFNFQVPKKQLTILKAEKEQAYQQGEDLKKLLAQIAVLQENHRTYDKDPEKNYGIPETMRTNFSALPAINSDTASAVNKLSNNLKYAYYELFTASQINHQIDQQAGNNQELQKEIDELEKELKELKRELKDCEADLYDCRRN